MEQWSRLWSDVRDQLQRLEEKKAKAKGKAPQTKFAVHLFNLQEKPASAFASTKKAPSAAALKKARSAKTKQLLQNSSDESGENGEGSQRAGNMVSWGLKIKAAHPKCKEHNGGYSACIVLPGGEEHHPLSAREFNTWVQLLVSKMWDSVTVPPPQLGITIQPVQRPQAKSSHPKPVSEPPVHTTQTHEQRAI